MSSYINVGFVMIERKELFIEKCVFLLKNHFLRNSVYVHMVDTEGEVWKEEKIVGELYDACKGCFHRNDNYILVDYVSELKIIKKIYVRIKCLTNNECGILFEIPEDELIQGDEIKIVESKIICEIEKCLEKGDAYAFCDNEVDIEYTKERLLQCKKKYSILAVNCENKVEIVRAEWRIDGLTRIA